DRKPSLSRLAGDRGGVDHEGVAVLGAGGAQQLIAFAVEEDDRAEIDADLHVEIFGLDVAHGSADPDPGVVDQYVEPSEAVAMGGDNLADDVLRARVTGHVLDVVAGAGQLRSRSLELLRPARGDRQAVPLLTKQPGDRQSNSAGRAGDNRGSLVLV